MTNSTQGDENNIDSSSGAQKDFQNALKKTLESDVTDAQLSAQEVLQKHIHAALNNVVEKSEKGEGIDELEKAKFVSGIEENLLNVLKEIEKKE